MTEEIPARPRTIAVDLDNTLADTRVWEGFGVISSPIPSMVDMVRKEKAKGARIIIHTCRVCDFNGELKTSHVETVSRWLSAHDVPVDEIWCGPGKPGADLYIDDKALNPNCPCCMKKYNG